ncbi:hypothetical protein BKA65DRAFT_572955 [Rhexocercosporidium sp. MPI-PUGE-AT-0058]|nr:hypothetical protein BKA65DRAFT_572955 [Rhexocercosporidium sp. MPI-PUGE-AT-0058]
MSAKRTSTHRSRDHQDTPDKESFRLPAPRIPSIDHQQYIPSEAHTAVMCVKEFLGYNCGHCAIPYLRQCPISASNPTFPPCKYPAERPIFTNENCHPCSRVLWNAKVLADEEKHRKQHAAGDCDCPVIFDAADRERRLRHRSGKAKNKGKELIQDEPSGADRAEGENLRDDRHVISNFGYDAHRDNDGPADPRQYDNGGDHASDNQQGWGPQVPAQTAPTSSILLVASEFPKTALSLLNSSHRTHS